MRRSLDNMFPGAGDEFPGVRFLPMEDVRDLYLIWIVYAYGRTCAAVSVGVSFARSSRTAGALKPGFGLSGDVLIFSILSSRPEQITARECLRVAAVRLLNAATRHRILHRSAEPVERAALSACRFPGRRNVRPSGETTGRWSAIGTKAGSLWRATPEP